MDDVTNILSHYFPEDHELIVRLSTSDCDLNEMREHFEELALLLKKNDESKSQSRATDYVTITHTLKSLRLEICEHLTKLK